MRRCLGSFPAPPAAGAPRLDRLHYFRTMYLRNLPGFALLVGVAAIAGHVLVIVVIVCFAAWLAGFLVLVAQIRRERARAAG